MQIHQCKYRTNLPIKSQIDGLSSLTSVFLLHRLADSESETFISLLVSLMSCK